MERACKTRASNTTAASQARKRRRGKSRDSRNRPTMWTGPRKARRARREETAQEPNGSDGAAKKSRLFKQSNRSNEKNRAKKYRIRGREELKRILPVCIAITQPGRDGAPGWLRQEANEPCPSNCLRDPGGGARMGGSLWRRRCAARFDGCLVLLLEGRSRGRRRLFLLFPRSGGRGWISWAETMGRPSGRGPSVVTAIAQCPLAASLSLMRNIR